MVPEEIIFKRRGDMLEDVSIRITKGLLKKRELVVIDLSNYNFPVSESYSIITNKLNKYSYQFEKFQNFLFIYIGDDKDNNIHELVLKCLKKKDYGNILLSSFTTSLFFLVFYLFFHFRDYCKFIFAKREVLIGTINYSYSPASYVGLSLYYILMIGCLALAVIGLIDIIKSFRNIYNQSKSIL